MTTSRFITIGFFFGLLAIPLEDVSSEESLKYVGADNCKMCHTSDLAGRQYPAWRMDKHSIAFWSLSSPQALQLAKKLKLTVEPAHNPQCLKCHTTAYDQSASKFFWTFKVEDGVQCETCHGPGSNYSKLEAMMDAAKARTAGLIDSDEKLCRSCHNPDSPNFKGFDYKTALQAISHVRTRWEVILPPKTTPAAIPSVTPAASPTPTPQPTPAGKVAKKK